MRCVYFHLQLINRDPEIRIGCGCGACQNHSGADIKQHSFFSRVGHLSLSLSLMHIHAQNTRTLSLVKTIPVSSAQ